MRTPALHAVRGSLIGCAEIVPGISGGTIALVVGIYERVLAAMREALHAAVALGRRDTPAARAALRRVEWGLVVPLLIGMAGAVLIGASVIPPLLDAHPEESSALFFGLILASLVVPWRMADRWHLRHLAIAAGFAGLAFLFTGIPERTVADPPMLAVFAAAAVAICALTLPGVSGSYLLLAVGLYAPTLEAVDNRDLGYLAVFALGALTGLALFTRVLTHLLAQHRTVTMAALLGLMTGSLRGLWPWSDDGALLAPEGDVASVLLAAFAGMAIVATLLLVTRRESN
jgi:putative membrane protein